MFFLENDESSVSVSNNRYEKNPTIYVVLNPRERERDEIRGDRIRDRVVNVDLQGCVHWIIPYIPRSQYLILTKGGAFVCVRDGMGPLW